MRCLLSVTALVTGINALNVTSKGVFDPSDANNFAMAQGSISDRDYVIEYDTKYGSTERFCKAYRETCVNLVGPYNYHHQLDCVFDQKGPQIKAFCGGRYKVDGNQEGSGPVFDFSIYACHRTKGCALKKRPTKPEIAYNPKWGKSQPPSKAVKSASQSSGSNKAKASGTENKAGKSGGSQKGSSSANSTSSGASSSKAGGSNVQASSGANKAAHTEYQSTTTVTPSSSSTSSSRLRNDLSSSAEVVSSSVIFISLALVGVSAMIL